MPPIPEGISAEAALDAMTGLNDILKEKFATASELIQTQHESLRRLQQELRNAVIVHDREEDKLK